MREGELEESHLLAISTAALPSEDGGDLVQRVGQVGEVEPAGRNGPVGETSDFKQAGAAVELVEGLAFAGKVELVCGAEGAEPEDGKSAEQQRRDPGSEVDSAAAQDRHIQNSSVGRVREDIGARPGSVVGKAQG